MNHKLKKKSDKLYVIKILNVCAHSKNNHTKKINRQTTDQEQIFITYLTKGLHADYIKISCHLMMKTQTTQFYF